MTPLTLRHAILAIRLAALLFCMMIFATPAYSRNHHATALRLAKLIIQFEKAVDEGHMDEVLRATTTLNLKLKTLGGKVWWDSYKVGKWILQVNKLSGWWRILDSSGKRLARGFSLDQLEDLLERRPASILSNYLDNGYRFIKYPSNGRAERTVILIHGWGVRSRSMKPLAEALASHHCDCYSYDYPSSKKSLKENVEFFLGKFRELLAELPKNQKVFIVTHSMGGLLLRGAMADMTARECHRIQAIVMLGPPNKGSTLAYLGRLPGISAINKSLEDMTPDDDSYAMTIPDPPWMPPIGIIAGKYDGKVSVESTRLPNRLPYKHLVVPCTHPGLRNPKNTLTHILRFFDTQAF